MATTNATVTHTYSSTPSWYDVKLAVKGDGKWDFYRQASAVRFVPAHFPDAPLANEPAPPATDPCGTLTPDEQAAITQSADHLMAGLSAATPEVVSTKR